MNKQWFSNIPPIWLISGGAALVILAGCTILAICGIVALVWYNGQTTSRAQEATQIARTRQTEAATNTPPLAMAMHPTPSALPLFNTRPPPPLPALAPTANPGVVVVSGSAPEEAVRTYYQLVSEGRYDLSWPMLTDRFKQEFNCCAPNYNYSGYVNWWDSVNYVALGSVRTVSQNGDRATVYAELDYVMNNGGRSTDRDAYIQLVYDAGMGMWRFDDKGATP